MSIVAPIAAALATAAIASVVAAPGARAATDCRTVGRTVVADSRARVYAYRHIVLNACVYGQRNNLGFFGELNTRIGVSGIQLAGTRLGYVARGPDVHGGDQPDVVRVVDLRRPSATPAQAIATSFVLASDGAFAALTQPDVNGAIRVLTVAAGHRTTVIASGAVVPGSLALTGRTFYWTQDGAPRSAVLPPTGG
ncbi:hypothetical protein [Conexibacter woesei]|uniref:hypothetical protein n=1 Tax=Conexibacter woesei TaxID=191495 RepID=UPI00047A5654|nr:hypothetical protein [Conexibacter woesei]